MNCASTARVRVAAEVGGHNLNVTAVFPVIYDEKSAGQDSTRGSNQVRNSHPTQGAEKRPQSVKPRQVLKRSLLLLRFAFCDQTSSWRSLLVFFPPF